MLFSSLCSFLSAYLWPSSFSNDYNYRRICLRGRGRVSKKVQDTQVLWLWSCSNFPPSSPPNPIFGHIIRSVLKNSIQKSFHSEEVPKREDLRRLRRCSTGHVHSVQLSHPLLSLLIPPSTSTYLWPTPCARGPAAIQQHNPQFMPLAVETNATPILAQSPIHRLAFARPVADKMQLTFPNSLSPPTLLLMQPGQPHTQSPQFKVNLPLQR